MSKKDSPTIDIAQVLETINRYQKHTGMTDQRLSLHACGNGVAVTRIKDGGGMINTVLQILDYIEKFPDGPIGFRDPDAASRRAAARASRLEVLSRRTRVRKRDKVRATV